MIYEYVIAMATIYIYRYFNVIIILKNLKITGASK